MFEILSEARRVLDIEAQALLKVKETLGEAFCQAVLKLSQCEGKIILTGMGKSGHIARKIASTLSSTGTSSFFVHPAESSHGDLGMIERSDIIIAISYSGESSELIPLLQYSKRKGIFIIGMTSNKKSLLGESSNIVLDLTIQAEACPMGLAPTTSTTLTLAMGDALAMCVLKIKGFKENHFAEFHPGGSLGKKLLTRVKDIMHKMNSLSFVFEETPMVQVIGNMTSYDVKGVTAVIDREENLKGVITDGDIRRGLKNHKEFFNLKAFEVMNSNPKTIAKDEMAEKAVFIMQEFKIQTLFVLNKENKICGIIHLQDLISFGLR